MSHPKSRIKIGLEDDPTIGLNQSVSLTGTGAGKSSIRDQQDVLSSTSGGVKISAAPLGDDFAGERGATPIPAPTPKPLTKEDVTVQQVPGGGFNIVEKATGTPATGFVVINGLLFTVEELQGKLGGSKIAQLGQTTGFQGLTSDAGVPLPPGFVLPDPGDPTGPTSAGKGAFSPLADGFDEPGGVEAAFRPETILTNRLKELRDQLRDNPNSSISDFLSPEDLKTLTELPQLTIDVSSAERDLGLTTSQINRLGIVDGRISVGIGFEEVTLTNPDGSVMTPEQIAFREQRGLPVTRTNYFYTDPSTGVGLVGFEGSVINAPSGQQIIEAHQAAQARLSAIAEDRAGTTNEARLRAIQDEIDQLLLPFETDIATEATEAIARTQSELAEASAIAIENARQLGEEKIDIAAEERQQEWTKQYDKILQGFALEIRAVDNAARDKIAQRDLLYEFGTGCPECGWQR
ncbi:MAG: hypothetical protein IID28_13925 [Planctomycetes bacterium]|nr:hypothetical protein [Planctomycetota bacterium]